MSDDELLEDDALDIDPDGRPMWLDFFGRKHSGKSELARQYIESWPYDALIIDPTGDFDPNGATTTPWPGGQVWPEREEGIARVHYRLKPNRREESTVKVGNRSVFRYLVDVDNAILAAHDLDEPVFIHIDDTPEEWLPFDSTALPGARVLLSESRHGRDFVSVCGPRPVGFNPKALSQADWVFLFQLPHELDVDTVAKTCGVSADDLRTLMKELEEEDHSFMRLDQLTHRVTLYPPVPL